ncbi:MAG: glutamate-cysteine ligase family protein, partial [Cyclobacteriaceae bacterium]|nr:glutamate-cysteine ligase family protein [Cyclobacteriaceae bacterium]
MGSLDVKLVSTQKQLNDFTKCLLRDVKALEAMLKGDYFEKGIEKIGVEQELCIVDNHYKPAPLAIELLEILEDESYTTELAKFNLEINLEPQEFTGKCFSILEQTLEAKLRYLEGKANEMGLDYVLTGILPSLRKVDLELDNLTPLKRYHALIKAISKLRGSYHELRIKGIDELNLKHDSAMLEAANTSFQVHLQVAPEEFVEKYNIAQTLTAPVLALAANSPMLFGKRLWGETRIALFQQSIDTRHSSEHLRDRSPRVMFGNQWLKESVLELFKEDIVRFRIMLMTSKEHDSLKELERGKTPGLEALMIHNSTVYRWNRPCYGVDIHGVPHLRIENRAFPSGPSVIDEVANAAFWLGLMKAFGDHYPDVHKLIGFDDVKSNFNAAAFNGMDSELKWFGNKKYTVKTLIKEELLPIAREGLMKNEVDSSDIDRYLDVIKERNETRQNGTHWILNSYASLVQEDIGKEEIPLAITAGMISNMKGGNPVHQWPLAILRDIRNWRPSGILVEEFMTTDLFTVNKEDIPELVADMMDWQK